MGRAPAIAFETMYQYLWRPFDQVDRENITVERRGNSWLNRLNLSWRNDKHLHFHISGGLTFTQNLQIASLEKKRTFENTFNPDLSASLDWRNKPWLSTHLTTSYGSTFVYLDNIPRKWQASYGFHLAPFYKSKIGFLKTFRTELIGFYIHLPDAQASISSLVPIFPYFYWQWKFSGSKK